MERLEINHSFFTKNVYYVLFYFLLDVHTLQRFSLKYIQFLVQLNDFIHHQLWFSLFIVLDRFRIITTLDPTLIFLTIIIKTEKKQWQWSDRKSTKKIKQRNDMRNTIHIKSQKINTKWRESANWCDISSVGWSQSRIYGP